MQAAATSKHPPPTPQVSAFIFLTSESSSKSIQLVLEVHVLWTWTFPSRTPTLPVCSEILKIIQRIFHETLKTAQIISLTCISKEMNLSAVWFWICRNVITCEDFKKTNKQTKNRLKWFQCISYKHLVVSCCTGTCNIVCWRIRDKWHQVHLNGLLQTFLLPQSSSAVILCFECELNVCQCK